MEFAARQDFREPKVPRVDHLDLNFVREIKANAAYFAPKLLILVSDIQLRGFSAADLCNVIRLRSFTYQGNLRGNYAVPSASVFSLQSSGRTRRIGSRLYTFEVESAFWAVPELIARGGN